MLVILVVKSTSVNIRTFKVRSLINSLIYWNQVLRLFNKQLFEIYRVSTLILLGNHISLWDVWLDNNNLYNSGQLASDTSVRILLPNMEVSLDKLLKLNQVNILNL